MTAPLTGHDGYTAWVAALQSICGHFETRVAFNRTLFIGEIATGTHAGLPLARLRTNAGLISRPRNMPDRDNDQHCFLVSQRSGHSRISQDGQSIDLAPGELLLMDSVGSCEITPLGLIEHVSLPLSRQAVIQTVGSKAFGKVSATQGCGRMLQLMVDQVCRDESTAGDDSEALQHALISLLPAALQAEPVSNARPDGLSGSTLRRYVQSLIDDSLGQPGLTPASLAERLNISVRHLYRLFEEEGDSVCRYIQRARLQRSADDLLNPLLRNESITAIAYKWGFTDSAHFSRAFKKQFDRSPKAYRSGMQA